MQTIDPAFYRSVPTEDLLRLLEEAREESECHPQSAERERWKMRLKAIEEELIHRQELLEQIEN